MGKLLYVCVISLVLFVGLTFAYMNNTPVEVRYFSLNIESNLAVLLLSALVLGVLLGFLVSALSSFKARRKVAKLKRELQYQQSANP